MRVTLTSTVFFFVYLRVDKFDGPVPVNNVVFGAGSHSLEAVFDLFIATHVLAVGGRRGPALRLQEQAIQHAAHSLRRPRPPGEGGIARVGRGRRGEGSFLLLLLLQVLQNISAKRFVLMPCSKSLNSSCP